MLHPHPEKPYPDSIPAMHSRQGNAKTFHKAGLPKQSALYSHKVVHNRKTWLLTTFMLRIGKIFLELLALLLAGMLLLGLFAFWRINRGPVNIDVLTPQITRAMNDLLPPGMSMGLDNVSLAWNSKADNLDFRARNIRLDEDGTTQAAQISQLGFSLSLRHLLLGQVRLTGLDLYRPQIHVLRHPDGHFGFSIAQEAPSSSPSQGIGALVSTLLHPPTAGQTGPIAILRRVTISDAALSITDQSLDLSWQIPQASLSLERAPEGLSAQGNFDLVLGEQVIPLHMTIKSREENPGLLATLAFTNLDPTLLAPLSVELEPLSNLDFPISGSATLSLADDLTPLAAEMLLEGATGKIMLPGLYPAPLNIRRASLKAGIDIPARQASLQEATIDLGGPLLRATGIVTEEGDIWYALIDAGAENVAVDSLEVFWPPDLGISAREWVLECLSRGTVQDARASFSLKAPIKTPADMTLEDISGQMTFSGVRVDYLPPMPVVTDVSGSARFDHDSFNILVDGGNMKDIRVGKSSIPITGLSNDSEHITLDLALDGSLPAILEAIDGEPLNLAKDLGLVPANIDGHTNGMLHLAFPLTHDLNVSDILVSATAQLTNTRLNGLVGNWPISEGTFDLSLDNKGMRVSGSANINGTPAMGTWEESFVAAAAPTRVTFKTTLSEGDRIRMGLDFIPRLSGSLGLDGTYTQASSGNGTLSGALDLENAAILVPEVGLEKTSGSDGTASFVATFREGRLEKVGNIRLNTDTIDATGEARMAQDNSLAAIDIDSLAFGKNTLKGHVLPLEKGGWSITLSGDALDLTPFLETQGPSVFPRAPPAGILPNLPIQLSFDVASALDKNGKLFDHFKGRLDLAGTRISSADAAGTLGKHRMTISFRPDEGTRHRLRIEMTDAGTFLMASDILGTVRGGSLVLDGRTEPRPTPESPFILKGALEMKNFVLVNAPVLARILNALSLPGFLELLGNEGFRFSQLYADFTFSPDTIDIREGRTAGASLGITFAGTLDRQKSHLDVGGIVIPVHGLNSILQDIPLFGNLLTGGEGGGLIAATYKISGPTRDPKTSVNPLSILMPGFLRSLFFPEEGSRILPNTPRQP